MILGKPLRPGSAPPLATRNTPWPSLDTGKRRLLCLKGRHMSSRCRLFRAILFWLILIPCTFAWGVELPPQAQAILKSPDVSFSGTYDLPCRPAVLDGLLGNPILLGRLWTAYGFAPAYKVRQHGKGLYVEDPTGIAGELLLLQHSGNRRVYLGDGALNHDLVPAFGGKMLLVLTTAPKATAVSARVDVYVQARSRVVGFLTSPLFSLMKERIENRMTVNAQDISVILKDVCTAPKQTASRLKGDDAAALLKLFPPQQRK